MARRDNLYKTNFITSDISLVVSITFILTELVIYIGATLISINYWLLFQREKSLSCLLLCRVDWLMRSNNEIASFP